MPQTRRHTLYKWKTVIATPTRLCQNSSSISCSFIVGPIYRFNWRSALVAETWRACCDPLMHASLIVISHKPLLWCSLHYFVYALSRGKWSITAAWKVIDSHSSHRSNVSFLTTTCVVWLENGALKAIRICCHTRHGCCLQERYQSCTIWWCAFKSFRSME